MKKKITDAQIKAATLPLGSTYLTLQERKDILLAACKERGIEASSVTPFVDLVKKLVPTQPCEIGILVGPDSYAKAINENFN